MSNIAAARREAKAQAEAARYECSNCHRKDFASLFIYSQHTRHCFEANRNTNNFTEWTKQYDKEHGHSRGGKHKYSRVLHLKKRQKITHDEEYGGTDDHIDDIFGCVLFI